MSLEFGMLCGIACIVLTFSAIIFVCVIRDGRRRIEEQRRAEGLCPGCGYDLRAAEGRCPECGKFLGQIPGVYSRHFTVSSAEKYDVRR